MKRLLIVEDHELVRAGLRELVNTMADLRIVSEAGNGAEALEAVRTHALDLVILDLSLPDCSGLDLMRSILAEKPDLPILILSMHAEATHARRMLNAGARGYVTKGSATDQLIVAIRTVASGERYVSRALDAELRVRGEAERREDRPTSPVFCLARECNLRLKNGTCGAGSIAPPLLTLHLPGAALLHGGSEPRIPCVRSV